MIKLTKCEKAALVCATCGGRRTELVLITEPDRGLILAEICQPCANKILEQFGAGVFRFRCRVTNRGLIAMVIGLLTAFIIVYGFHAP